MKDPRVAFREAMDETNGNEMRVRRLFFDLPPKALSENLQDLLKIKSDISKHFDCDYKNVMFCGSAQLGFSPIKDTDFSIGSSDLDIAIVDVQLFQDIWKSLLTISRAFNDQAVFPANCDVENVQKMLSKRGVLHLHDMPRRGRFILDSAFTQSISARYTNYFSKINVSFYVNEYSFIWKQASGISQFVRI